MSTLTGEQLRNVAKHLSAMIDCMARARETLDDKDYARFLDVMIEELAKEQADGWVTEEDVLSFPDIRTALEEGLRELRAKEQPDADRY